MSSNLGQIRFFTSELLTLEPLNQCCLINNFFLFFYWFSSNLQIISTCINLGWVQIWARLDNSLQNYSPMYVKINFFLSITCLLFYPIFIELAGNQHIHKISVLFGAWSDYSLQSYLPLNTKIDVVRSITFLFFIRSLIKLMSSNLGQIWLFPSELLAIEWQNKCCSIYNFFIFYLNLQITSTCIKSQISSDLGQIWLFPSELLVIECQNKCCSIYNFFIFCLNLQITSTCIKSQITSDLGQISLFTSDYLLLEHQN